VGNAPGDRLLRRVFGDHSFRRMLGGHSLHRLDKAPRLFPRAYSLTHNREDVNPFFIVLLHKILFDCLYK
jgi:hypothetical protein